MTEFYKVLDEGRLPYYGGKGVWHPNAWMPTVDDPRPCVRGYHLCRREDLVYWLGPTVWEAKAGDTIIPDSLTGPKVVTERARLVRRFKTWNVRTQRLFAADCAEHVLWRFEEQHPLDGRPREALETLRAYLDGTINFQVVEHAAWAAIEAAAASAADEAAAASAYFAARAAYHATRKGGFVRPVRAAAQAARTAATHMARSFNRGDVLASNAFFTTIRSGSVGGEGLWQTERLFDYLEGRLPC